MGERRPAVVLELRGHTRAHLVQVAGLDEHRRARRIVAQVVTVGDEVPRPGRAVRFPVVVGIPRELRVEQPWLAAVQQDAPCGSPRDRVMGDRGVEERHLEATAGAKFARPQRRLRRPITNSSVEDRILKAIAENPRCTHASRQHRQPMSRNGKLRHARNPGQRRNRLDLRAGSVLAADRREPAVGGNFLEETNRPRESNPEGFVARPVTGGGYVGKNR